MSAEPAVHEYTLERIELGTGATAWQAICTCGDEGHYRLLYESADRDGQTHVDEAVAR